MEQTRDTNETFKQKIFRIIQIGNRSDLPSRICDIVIVVSIVLNILMMYLETFQALSAYFTLFRIVEIATLAIFTVEYILRIWTADCLYPEEKSKGRAIFRFLRSYDGIVDLLTILPFYFLSGFIAFRMLRVVRIFHLFRINATTDSFHVILTVLKEKKNEILSSLFIILILMLGAALGMYHAEHEAQPEMFTDAFQGIWWSVSALLTVGYGDIYPITIVGKICAILISFLGVGAVAIPTGIISSGFYEQYTMAENSTRGYRVQVQDVTIDIDSRWIGRSVKEIIDEDHVVILLVERNKAVFSPGETYRVHLGDFLQIYHIPLNKNEELVQN